MRSVDESFYKTKQWRHLRDEYMKKVDGLCERCRANGLIVPAKIVHHKEHLNESNVKDAKISLSFDNLEALCQDCHNLEHFGEKKVERWKFVDGRLEVRG